jgi:hypothetical protein
MALWRRVSLPRRMSLFLETEQSQHGRKKRMKGEPFAISSNVMHGYSYARKCQPTDQATAGEMKAATATALEILAAPDEAAVPIL